MSISFKQLPYSCFYCSKHYVKKSNFDNHVVLCELFHKSRNATVIDKEVPCPRKMFEMIIELGKKLNNMEDKVEEINKWVIRKKKKINIIEWLNTHATPDFKFDYLTNKISISDEDIDSLFTNSFIDLLCNIIGRIFDFADNKYPMFAFVQKNNLFYIYDNEDIGWTELSREKFIKFLNNVFMKISKEFFEWKKRNKSKIDSDEKLQISCDKTTVKMYSVDFKVETTLNKIKCVLFSRIKTDMKALVEYEFEF